jgi:hypothetical protein
MALDPVLDLPMIQLSDVDVLRFRDLIEGGVLVTGGRIWQKLNKWKKPLNGGA